MDLREKEKELAELFARLGIYDLEEQIKIAEEIEKNSQTDLTPTGTQDKDAELEI